MAAQSDNKFDFAIFYPIDTILRQSKSENKIYNLCKEKQVDKVFLISWTDHQIDDYSRIEQFINVRTIYDAEEEDIDYHRRVLGLE